MRLAQFLYFAKAMKKYFIFLLIIVFSPLLVFAQESTEPDTAQIRALKVHTVKVMYANKNYSGPHHEYEFDKRGRLIRDKYADQQSWTYYKYDQQNRIVEQGTSHPQYGNNVQFRIQYPEGKFYREVTYYDTDGSEQEKIKNVYRYDTLNRMIYQAWYVNNAISHVQYLFPRGKNQPTDARDSIISTREVVWMTNGKMSKMMKYDEQWKNPITKIYTYSDIDGSFIKEEILEGNTKTVYIPKYDTQSQIESVICNGKPLDEIEKKKWINEHRAFPKPPSQYIEDFERLPYGLPVPDEHVDRKQEFDSKGLLIKEIVTTSWQPDLPATFTYSYTFY
jgi:outer membrane lipoprotein-sorting protein